MAKKAAKRMRTATKQGETAIGLPKSKDAAQGASGPRVSFHNGSVVEVQVSTDVYQQAMSLLVGPHDLTGVCAVAIAVPGAAGVATATLRCLQDTQADEIVKSMKG